MSQELVRRPRFKNAALNSIGITYEQYYAALAGVVAPPCKMCQSEPACKVDTIHENLKGLCWVCRRIEVSANRRNWEGGDEEDLESERKEGKA